MPTADRVETADGTCLDRWLAWCDRAPGSLPPEVEPVQTRLVRAVGRGEVPGIGEVFLKVMGFPRLRDRIRYVHRRLPGIHEASLLRRLRSRGIACPEVVLSAGRRRFGMPWLSLLCTRAIVRDGDVTFEAAARLAARLADLGVFHPDLKPDNFIRRPDGEVAVLDLQSARWFAAPLSAARRQRMATKLVAEFDAVDRVDSLLEVGLVSAVDDIAAAVSAQRVDDIARRVSRCLTTSTDFVVEWRWSGRVHRRRTVDLTADSSWSKCPDARVLWLGDRVRHVLDGVEPRLGALFEKWWWLPGESSVYIPGDDGDRSLSAADSARLREAFARWRFDARRRRAG